MLLKMVAPVGIEPTSLCLRGRRCTAQLQGNKLWQSISPSAGATPQGAWERSVTVAGRPTPASRPEGFLRLPSYTKTSVARGRRATFHLTVTSCSLVAGFLLPLTLCRTLPQRTNQTNFGGDKENRTLPQTVQGSVAALGTCAPSCKAFFYNSNFLPLFNRYAIPPRQAGRNSWGLSGS